MCIPSAAIAPQPLSGYADSIANTMGDSNTKRSMRILPGCHCSCAISLLHERERNHVPDAGAVGEQHDEAVDPEAHASRRRHAILQSRDEVLIQLDLRSNEYTGPEPESAQQFPPMEGSRLLAVRYTRWQHVG